MTFLNCSKLPANITSNKRCVVLEVAMKLANRPRGQVRSRRSHEREKDRSLMPKKTNILSGKRPTLLEPENPRQIGNQIYKDHLCLSLAFFSTPLCVVPAIHPRDQVQRSHQGKKGAVINKLLQEQQLQKRSQSHDQGRDQGCQEFQRTVQSPWKIVRVIITAKEKDEPLNPLIQRQRRTREGRGKHPQPFAQLH